MDKERVGKALGRAVKGYAKYTGWTTHPLLAALTHGAAGAGLAALAARPASRMVERADQMLSGRNVQFESPQERKRRRSLLKSRLMLAGALAGSAFPLWSAWEMGKAGDEEVAFRVKKALDAYSWVNEPVGIGTSMEQIATDPNMSVTQKAQAMLIVQTAGGGKPKGLVPAGRIANKAVAAGAGAAGASAFAAILALPKPLTNRAIQAGMLAGALFG